LHCLFDAFELLSFHLFIYVYSLFDFYKFIFNYHYYDFFPKNSVFFWLFLIDGGYRDSLLETAQEA